MRDLQMKADLNTDRVMAENFKELFLTYNKPWLRENIQEVFTPRTLFEHKKTIAEEFQKILGPLSPNISEDQKQVKNAAKSIYDLAGDINDKKESGEDSPLNTSERKYMAE